VSLSLPAPIRPEIAERVNRLEIPFNRWGVDPYGIDRNELARFFSLLHWLYRYYFAVSVYGIAHVPKRGRVMLVGNHSGGVALDGMMTVASTFFEMDPPRLAEGMAEKFIARFPVFGNWSSRLGHFTGLPEHAVRLLEDERMLLVFPEGVRGTAKLYPDRDSLVRFGTGFVRLAAKTRTPIVPFAFVGGGEAIPTVANVTKGAKALGVPYFPVTPYVVPFPLPVSFQILYGRPFRFEGTGNEVDQVVLERVEMVRGAIGDLIRQGRALRQGRLRAQDLDWGRRPEDDEDQTARTEDHAMDDGVSARPAGAATSREGLSR